MRIMKKSRIHVHPLPAILRKACSEFALKKKVSYVVINLVMKNFFFRK